VLLARRDLQRHRFALAFHPQMELAAQTASALADGLALPPPFCPPAACW
jgi:hypothetical protein